MVVVGTHTISTSENSYAHNRADRIATGYTGQLFLCLYNLAKKPKVVSFFMRDNEVELKLFLM